MAAFEPAFERMIKDEGGFRLHSVAGDRGGQTYAGIARKFHPSWKGWPLIDRGETASTELTNLVREFYRERFWERIRGEEISRQAVASTLFNFAVNAGTGTAVKLAQIVVDAIPDGVMGPKTLAALNGSEEEMFVLRYALAKVARYAAICTRDGNQKKFLLGWINRTLREAS